MVSLLKWWLIICLTILGVVTGVYFDMHNHIYDADVTKLSFLILAIFSCTSIWIGNKTYRLEKYAEYEQTTNVGWLWLKRV